MHCETAFVCSIPQTASLLSCPRFLTGQRMAVPYRAERVEREGERERGREGEREREPVGKGEGDEGERWGGRGKDRGRERADRR
eukprot:1355178-Rhodomonas_salina.1